MGNQNRKPMALWKMIIMDLLLTGVSLCVFALFHHVLPQRSANQGTVISQVGDDSKNNFNLPDTQEETTKKSKGARPGTYTGSSKTQDVEGDIQEREEISKAGKTESVIQSYKDGNVSMEIKKIEVGTGEDKITYYAADVYVTNVKYIKTAFAGDTYGKNLREEVTEIGKRSQAILSISGDFYGNSEEGVVIRNGVYYRSVLTKADICVLFIDGTMKTYSPEEFSVDEVVQQGAWQAWTFGPSLLDEKGGVLSVFNSTSYLNSKNPRGAIGYVDQGHYVFVVVDGREDGYSCGATLSELGQIMADLKCKTAYNLDGGKSAIMVYEDETISQPVGGGRTISDIVYIGGN